MGIFDAINMAEGAMSVHRYRSEVAAENIANVYTEGYQRKDVKIEATNFTNALDAARAGGGGSVLGATTGTIQAGGGAIRVARVELEPDRKFDERQQALQGVSDMYEAKTAFELSLRAATMMKSMALSSLEIGRGA